MVGRRRAQGRHLAGVRRGGMRGVRGYGRVRARPWPIVKCAGGAVVEQMRHAWAALGSIRLAWVMRGDARMRRAWVVVRRSGVEAAGCAAGPTHTMTSRGVVGVTLRPSVCFAMPVVLGVGHFADSDEVGDGSATARRGLRWWLGMMRLMVVLVMTLRPMVSSGRRIRGERGARRHRGGAGDDVVDAWSTKSSFVVSISVVAAEAVARQTTRRSRGVVVVRMRVMRIG